MSVKTQLAQSLKDAPFKSYVYLSFFMNFGTLFVVLIFKNLLPPTVPLFYGRAVGPDQLIPVYGLLVAPGISFLITLLNLYLSFKSQDVFTKKVYIAASFLVSLLTTITILKIIFLVGFF
ncbi:MAG TPA: hypothetical protein VFI61_03125 [Patescibacteria group bacterium]|nr:hypothetical protein [Patescibacteria group bacterium]